MKNLNEEFAPDSAMALADYLGVDVDTVVSQEYEHYGHIPVYEAGGEEWAVTDDYDACERAGYVEVEELIDELGYDSLNWDNMGGIEEYVDENWFEEAMRESYQFYAEDIESESASSDEYENRLQEEMAEVGVETVEDFVDHFVEDNMNYYGNAVKWYISEYGNESFQHLIKEGVITIDSEKAAEEVISTDGLGHILSSYDGRMVEHDYDGRTYYMFRLN